MSKVTKPNPKIDELTKPLKFKKLNETISRSKVCFQQIYTVTLSVPSAANHAIKFCNLLLATV